MAEIDGEGELNRPSDYHMSETYVAKKGHEPDTTTYLEYLTNDNTEKYLNAIDEQISQSVKCKT